MMQRIHRAGDDDVNATVTSREGECRSSTLVANGGVHVGVCGTWILVAILYRGCYRDLPLVMQRIDRAGDDGVSATVTSREGDVAAARWSPMGAFMLAFVGRVISRQKKL